MEAHQPVPSPDRTPHNPTGLAKLYQNKWAQRISNAGLVISTGLLTWATIRYSLSGNEPAAIVSGVTASLNGFSMAVKGLLWGQNKFGRS